MFSTKFRTILAGSLAAAALAAPQAASAATPVHSAPVSSSALHVVTTPKVVLPLLRAGGAGIAGYDDDTCQRLADDYTTTIEYAEGYIAEGNTESARYYSNLAKKIWDQLTDNCVVFW